MGSGRQALDAGGTVAADAKDAASEIGGAVRRQGGKLGSAITERRDGLRTRLQRKDKQPGGND